MEEGLADVGRKGPCLRETSDRYGDIKNAHFDVMLGFIISTIRDRTLTTVPRMSCCDV